MRPERTIINFTVTKNQRLATKEMPAENKERGKPCPNGR